MLIPDAMARPWVSDNAEVHFSFLGAELLRAIRVRDDLRLTGRDCSFLPIGERIVLPRDIFETNSFLHLYLLDGSLRIRLPNTSAWRRLYVVRVERNDEPKRGESAEPKRGESAEPQSEPKAARPPAESEIRRRYNEAYDGGMTTRRVAESWAKSNRYSTTVVRSLHLEKGNKKGRPRKNVGANYRA